ncbi:MAG TPA: hypothetical protein VN792_03150 [Candidatus Acidoferrales bacterium]|nr:hypothetical protein [Candidatus Acidoferrales bacterium]
MPSAVRFTRSNIPMRATKNSRRFIFAILLCAATSFGGCGRGKSAPPSEGAAKASAPAESAFAEPPLDQQTEQKLDPLTKEDAELYLKVMHAAAERVTNLTPPDRAALDGAKRILAGSASGRVPTPADVKTLAQANLVAIAMDQIVAGEMKLDGRTYRGIAEAVEAVVPNPALGAASGDGGAPHSDHAATPLEKRLNDVNAANEKVLAPYRAEIQQLIAVVRSPANLPK